MCRLSRGWGGSSEGMYCAITNKMAPHLHSTFKVGFKSFLNITPTVIHGAPVPPPPPSPNRPNSTSQQASVGSSFTLTLEENPLAEFVELPDEVLEGGLWYSNVLCGVIRGALEMVRFFLFGGSECGKK